MAKKQSSKSKLELIFWSVLCGMGVEKKFQKQFRFHPDRRWKFDFADVNNMVAVEIDGGIFMPKGGHNTGKAIIDDHEKMNVALCLGWRVLHYSTLEEFADFKWHYQNLLTLKKIEIQLDK